MDDGTHHVLWRLHYVADGSHAGAGEVEVLKTTMPLTPLLLPLL